MPPLPVKATYPRQPVPLVVSCGGPARPGKSYMALVIFSVPRLSRFILKTRPVFGLEEARHIQQMGSRKPPENVSKNGR